MMRRSTSVAALCMVTFLQAYLLVSVFPYAAYMSVLLWNKRAADEEGAHDGPQTITVEEAGPYAALLATSFMIGRTVAAIIWGKLADVYGRRWVLLTSLIGSGLATLWFGMSTTYATAVVARGVVGAWNSVVGVSKTLATELAYHDFGSDRCDNSSHDRTEYPKQGTGQRDMRKDELETKIVGLVTSMRAWGFLVAPAIAGLLADPLGCREGCNDTKEQTAHPIYGLFRNELVRYPYLPPNLLGAIIAWSAALAVFFGMPETLPECRSAQSLGRDLCCWVTEHARYACDTCKRATKQSWTKAHEHSDTIQYGSIEEDSNESDENGGQAATLRSIWSRCGYHLLAYWSYSLVVIAIDEAFPLFCISSTNGIGVGLSEPEIGEVLSLSGLIFAAAQYKAYTSIVDKYGVHRSLSIGCYVGVLPVGLIPLASLFPGKCGAMLYLSLLMGLTKILQSTFFSSITIATNRTVPKDSRSSVNGIGGMGAGVAKAVGPMATGFWVAFWLSKDHDEGRHLPVDSFVAFGGIAGLVMPIIALLPLLQNEA